MFYLSDIRKNPDGISFNRELKVTDTIQQREPSILDISPITVSGQLRKEQDLYLLDYTMTYSITLPSSRSLLPVSLDNSQAVNEVFIEAAKQAAQRDLVEENLVLILEEDHIDLTESVLDNILLNLPIKVLSPEEEASEQLPSGQNWTMLTENQYQASQEEQRAANNPFAGLDGLFD